MSPVYTQTGSPVDVMCFSFSNPFSINGPFGTFELWVDGESVGGRMTIKFLFGLPTNTYLNLSGTCGGVEQHDCTLQGTGYIVQVGQQPSKVGLGMKITLNESWSEGTLVFTQGVGKIDGLTVTRQECAPSTLSGQLPVMEITCGFSLSNGASPVATFAWSGDIKQVGDSYNINLPPSGATTININLATSVNGATFDNKAPMTWPRSGPWDTLHQPSCINAVGVLPNGTLSFTDSNNSEGSYAFQVVVRVGDTLYTSPDPVIVNEAPPPNSYPTQPSELVTS
jgi:hypothetical protein